MASSDSESYSDGSGIVISALRKGKKPARDEDEVSDPIVDAAQAAALAAAPYGGSAVLQKIMARKAKWQFQKKTDEDKSDKEDDEDSDEDGGKKKKKGKAAAAKKGKDTVETNRLEATEPGYREMLSHFMSHHEATTEVESIIDVSNTATRAAFEEYRDKIAEKRPYLVRNQLLTKRLYHGTLVRCTLGLEGNTTPCVHPDCRACQIIRKGFRLAKWGTGARKPPDAKDCAKFARFGKGLYFSDWASSAQEYSTAYPCAVGRAGRTAVLACQVVTGKSQPLWAYDGKLKAPAKGYDSVKGELANADHPDAPLKAPEYVVYDENAACVTQVFIYTHSAPLCPKCGLRVGMDEAVPNAKLKDEYGWFCSEGCKEAFQGELEEFEEQIRETPTDLEDPGMMPFWDKTTSEENCDIIPLWPGSKEATIVTVKFKKTLPNAKIHKIFRVQNIFLHSRYWQEMKAMMSRNGGVANEVLVFHGTRQTSPDEIYDTDEGFDFRHCQWGMWGKGSYFAVNSSYSNNYAFCEPNGYKTMFMAKVMLGDSTEIPDDDTLTMPPEKPVDTTKLKNGKKPKRQRYDSVTGWTGGSKVHIVYAPAKCYPAYLITYSSGSQWSY